MTAQSHQGLTLTEVLVAAVLTISVIVGVGVIGRQRDAFMVQIRGATMPIGEELRPAIGVMGMARMLETADRAILPPVPANGWLQLRVPSPQGACAAAPYDTVCLDDPTNYQWLEYAYADTDADGTRETLELYTDTANGCAQRVTLSSRIASITFTYVNAAGPPPGGDPAVAAFSPSPRDMNVVQYAVRWTGPLSGVVLVPPATGRTYTGTVTMRNMPYSDNGAGTAGLTDSGLGLTGSTVAPPPARCCLPPRCV